mmetsp:Transcript_21364/g.70627  ORF Transcript_21364/g.70627 Transcript_21364/m.70627 type:complete len:127 (-) Transcript_21364:917-1297(-)
MRNGKPSSGARSARVGGAQRRARFSRMFALPYQVDTLSTWSIGHANGSGWGEGDAECQLLPEGVHKVHMLSATGMQVFRAPGKRGRQRAGLCVLVVQHEEALSVCLVPERRGCHRVAIDEPQPPQA